jgi:hypothetical protein
MYIHSIVENDFRDWTLLIAFGVWKQSLRMLLTVRINRICRDKCGVGVENREAIFVDEMMAEDINSAIDCVEVGVREYADRIGLFSEKTVTFLV